MKIYELLSLPDKWTKKWYARDVNGNCVFSADPKAVSWCLLGAIYKCYGSSHEVIKSIIWPQLGSSSITEWNDSHNYEEVITLCKKLDI